MKRQDLPAQMDVGDPVDFDILYRALENHPRAKEKIGCGVTGIFVRRNRATNGEDVCCCHVRRADGSEEDFSVYVCFRTRSWKDIGKSYDANLGTLSFRGQGEM